jgi:integrase
MVYLWSDELRQAVNQAMQIRRKTNSQWLFHTNTGQPYIKDDGNAAGFSSIWQRFMAKVLAETKVKERFTEHDLRAKVASDVDAEHARKLLGHATAQITQKVYRRRPEYVVPAK